MSEYQYYEFQAIDRPLTEAEMQKLRSYSTRARVTPTSFVNVYNWGNFKGDEDAWMEKYFDAFLYVANWGTHVLKLRFPSDVLPLETAKQYCRTPFVFAKEKAGKVIVTFVSEDDSGDNWDDTGEGWLASLVPIRAEIARGDLRALYLGWLLCAQTEELHDGDREPPVPAGLGELSASLQSLAEFLRIDGHLLAAAAERSARDESPSQESLARWVAALQPKEKDEMLVALMRGGGTHAGSQLMARFRRDQRSPDRAGSPPDVEPGRTVNELLQGAAELTSIAAEKAAKEHARREQEKIAARTKYLDGLVGREPTLWKEVERLIAEKKPTSYDAALVVLSNLRDLAARTKGNNFPQKIEALRAAHARKTSFISKLKKAGF
ncbi:MAG: hypothetical protein ABIF82_04685 [Planctomycetota bacterium]